MYCRRMSRKFGEYEGIMCCELNSAAWMVFPRISNDYWVNPVFFRAFVELSKYYLTVEVNKSYDSTSQSSFLKLFEGEDSPDGTPLHKVNGFLRSTSSEDDLADSQMWWRSNANCFPAICKLVRYVLAIQCRSLQSGSVFLVVEKIMIRLELCFVNMQEFH